MRVSPLFYGPLLHLRTLPALAHLRPDELAAVAQRAEEVHLALGSRLDSSGPAAEALHQVVSGALEVRGPGGVRSHGPGTYVGIVETLAGRADEVAATAITDTVVLRLDWDVMVELWERHFGLLRATLELLASRALRARAGLSAGGGEADPAPPWIGAGSDPDLVQRVLTLREAPLFPPAHMDGLIELARDMDLVRWRAGEIVFGADPDPRADCLLLCRGQVEHSSENGERGAALLGTLGLLELLADQPITRDVRAVTDIVAFRISGDTLLDLFDDHFELSLGFMSRLAERILRAEQQEGTTT